jgi:2,3-bisphosphoglycerate-dependent phosphoglycerate mutase
LVPKRGSLLLLRHGESTANAAGLFTGILDVGLTEVGFAEARIAADLVRATQVHLDVVFVSELLRAKQTATMILDVLDLTMLHPIADWRLNERNYGALTGRSKQEVLAEYGEPLFHSWRRSVDVAPPPMPDEQFAALASSHPFSSWPTAALTLTESLGDVITRVRAFYTQRVLPELFAGSNVLLVGHGNSLRALCAELDQLTTKEVEALNIPTGQPLLYEFDAALSPLPRRNRYLDPVTALSAATVIAQQGGT